MERDSMQRGPLSLAGGATRFRWLLALAALASVIGIGVSGLKMWRLSAIYRDEAATFADLESKAKLSYCSRDMTFAALDTESQVASINAEAGSAQAIEWLGRMRKRYQYAASHPWKALTPVPTMQEWAQPLK
jgi:hypothetical protein